MGGEIPGIGAVAAVTVVTAVLAAPLCWPATVVPGAAPGVAGSTGRAWPPPVIVGVGGGDGLIFGAPGGE